MLIGKKSGKLIIPSNCILLGSRNDVSKEDYTITYKVTSDWKEAFNGDISITNNTSKKIEAWQLEFDFEHSINNFWTAKILSHESNHYIIKNDEWNSTIKPGDTIHLGFEAKVISEKFSKEPYNFKLTALDSENITEEPDDEENYIYDFSEEELAIDTDKDGLPDCYEKEILKTDPNKEDTDGDGLPDGYEIFNTGSDPLVKDSDLDNDGDGLTNLKEYQLKSDPNLEDSDYDKINDFDEVNKYKTDPIDMDTDKDGINDGNELILGLNPVIKDTDGNGINDGKEKIEQTYTQKFDNDFLSKDVIGLVGVPIGIETESEFDKATVTIHYQSLPKDVKAENLGILWYNEKNNRYDIIKSKTNIKDKEVTFETSHFSTYLLTDMKQWLNVWDNPISYGNSKKAVDTCDVAYVVDISKSMDTENFKKVRKAMKDLTDTMLSSEKAALIGYQITSCTLFQGLTGSKKALKESLDKIEPEKKSKSAGVTNEGIRKGINQLKKGNTSNGRVLFIIGDADIAYDKTLVEQAKKEHIQIFAVNINKDNNLEQLKKYAFETKGFYYTLEEMQYLQGVLFDIKNLVLERIDTTDTDGDGLFDVYETKGLRAPNGIPMKSNPNKEDTDGDGLSDLEETGFPVWEKKDFAQGNSIRFYKQSSSTHSNSKWEDSDYDGIPDSLDVNVANSKQTSKYVHNDGKKLISYAQDKEYTLEFIMNYSWFLKSNIKYNKKIAHLSSIMAGLAYYAPYDKDASYYKIKIKNKSKKNKTYNLENFMKYTGFKDTKRCYLGQNYKKDNHIVQFNYGYKELKKGKTKKYLVPIIIRGTSGAKEWRSNFTIGKSGEHEGFSITANRIIKEINAYLSKHNISSKDAVLWITGHSRGGGVANLVARKMIDRKYKVFAYTFAAPAVTQTSVLTY